MFAKFAEGCINMYSSCLEYTYMGNHSKVINAFEWNNTANACYFQYKLAHVKLSKFLIKKLAG